MIAYHAEFQVGWGDLDANGHMRNTAFLDMAATTRMRFFAEHGFPIESFAQLRIGPVVRKDEVTYFKEFKLLEGIKVSFELGGLSSDASRMKLCNRFYKSDGRLAAEVMTTGGWMDLKARSLIAPPEPLANLLREMARTEGFEELATSLKS
ncbi:MAG: thioesterase family protein [Acidobacteria bacterium]|nr:thioesterase family protein [Acidobacteriota bacterium]MCB9397268.1 thioesterase family protein [Acidobacteriota bacterium]